MFRRGGQKKPSYEHTPVVFREAEEVKSPRLMELFHFLTLCEKAGELSMSAYVVREAVEADLDEFKAHTYRMGHKADYLLGRDISLHTHPGSGQTLDDTITINRVYQGSAEAAVLEWPGAPKLTERPYHGYVAHYAARDDNTIAKLYAELFDQKTVRTTGSHAPIDGVHAILNPGDVLIFDHTLPHAFRSLTPDRASEAFFNRY